MSKKLMMTQAYIAENGIDLSGVHEAAAAACRAVDALIDVAETDIDERVRGGVFSAIALTLIDNGLLCGDQSAEVDK